MLRKLLATLTVTLLAGQLSCYNTYNVSLDELGKTQEGGQSSTATLFIKPCQQLRVEADSDLLIRDLEGKSHNIKAFQFALDEEMLMAGDLSLERAQIRSIHLPQPGVEEPPAINPVLFAGLQEGQEPKEIDCGCTQVVVTEDTKIGVTDKLDKYHPISPFNFTLTRGQMVAPDEDLLLSRDEIQTGNVKVVSGLKTGLLVATGVVAVLGAAVGIILTAEERKEFGEK